MRYFLALLCCLLLAFAGPANAAHYHSDEHIELEQVLAPPPAPGSAAQQADMAAVLADQASRSPTEIDAAQGDAQISIYRFADVLGEKFHTGALSKTEALFQAVGEDSRDIVSEAKDHWGRPRPFVINADVHTIVQQPANGAYPSGHATFGYLTAILLANMIPEKADALYDRGRQYGQNRVVAGVHYPTDVEAGRITASTIANGLLSDPAFQHDFATAKTELRQVLGYPDN